MRMKNRRVKVYLSILFLSSSLLFLTVRYENIYRPWSFGFLVSLSRKITVTGTTITQFIHEQREFSPAFIVFANMMTELLGSQKWLSLPGFAFIGLFPFAYLNRMDSEDKLLVTFAAIAGPLGAISYTIVPFRGWFDIVVIWTLILYLAVLERQHSGPRFFSITMGVASFILWIGHYSVWPFVFILSVIYSFTTFHQNQNIHAPLSVPVFTIAAFVIHPAPAQIYIGKFVALLSIDPNQYIDTVLSGTITSIQGIDSSLIVNAPPERQPGWMPGLTYKLYAFPLLILGTGVSYLIGQNAITILTKRSVSYPIFMATITAFGLVSFLYVVAGYLFRTLFFWPIVIPVMVKAIYHHGSDVLSRRPIASINKRGVMMIVVLIALVHVSPIVVPGYFTDRSTVASPTQVAGSDFTDSIPREERVYTDLVHASTMILRTSHQNVQVGHAQTVNDKTALSKDAAVLYQPNRLESGYLLTTTNVSNVERIIFWEGTKAPTVSRTTQHEQTTKIYANGGDVIYLK